MTLTPRVFVPPDLNYDCHSCGRCCRDWLILCPDKEAQALLSRDWGETFPDLKGVPLFRNTIERPEGTMHRLNFKEDGTCIFLDTENRCRIHSTLGSAAKPLVCRVFPYTFTHTPSGIFVSLKMSCPSAIAGKGRPMEVQREEAAALATASARDTLPHPIPGSVRFTRKLKLPWTDIVGIQEIFDELIHQRGVPFLHRLVAILRLTRLMQEARLTALAEGQAVEFCRILGKDYTTQATAGALESPGAPRFGTRIQFRQFLQMFTFREFTDYQAASLGRKIRLRLRFMADGLRFALGHGEIVLRGLGGALPLREVDAVPMPSSTPEIDALFERFCSSKLFGQLAYGPSAGGLPFTTGTAVLAVDCAAIAWYARAVAFGRKSATVEAQDVAEAIWIVDSSLSSSRILYYAAARAVVVGITYKDSAERLVWSWMPPPATTPAVALALGPMHV